MAAPDFSQSVVDLLAFRSGLICNNPRCNTLTVGPSDGRGRLATKIGEAAHVCAARKGEARYERSMTDKARADIANGIWLCASCHTMIDKNKGADFTVNTLRSWKEQHEATIRSLLLSHRSPLPIIRAYTEEGKKAQDAIDLLEQHGAFYEDFTYEFPQYVESSLDYVRKELQLIIKNVKYDKELRIIIAGISKECQNYMNKTGNFPSQKWDTLKTMRHHIGVYIRRLRDEYGCMVTGDLNRIIP